MKMLKQLFLGHCEIFDMNDDCFVHNGPSLQAATKNGGLDLSKPPLGYVE